jgi:hypothetical protein
MIIGLVTEPIIIIIYNGPAINNIYIYIYIYILPVYSVLERGSDSFQVMFACCVTQLISANIRFVYRCLS